MQVAIPWPAHVGFFDRFGAGKSERGRKAALVKERAGDLEAAVHLYVEAGLPDEAARVLLLRADAEARAERRIAFCDMASRTAASPEFKKKALARKGRLAFDMLKAEGAARVQSEFAAVGRDLEEAGDLELAADAFALAGDAESEMRVLTAAGAIEKMEERFRAVDQSARAERERSTLLSRIKDFDRTAERREALKLASAWLINHRGDEAVAELERTIRLRLARGPMIELELLGSRVRCAFGPDVTVGRGDATVVIASRAVSRKHIRVFRSGAGVMVEDLGTRNGTTLAGARISAPIAVGDGLRLELGAGVPCAITPLQEPFGGAIEIEVGGLKYVAPLGGLHVGHLVLEEEIWEGQSLLVLRSPGTVKPVISGYTVASTVELCVGDAVSETRGGPALIRVPSHPAEQAPAPGSWI